MIPAQYLEGFLSSIKLKKVEPIYDTPSIILRGFVRRADGIGAHMPNLYDNVFNEYKHVSFACPPDRKPFMNGFLEEVISLKPEDTAPWQKDFEWINKFRLHENRHLESPLNYTNSKVINVGGFCGPLPREYDNNFLDFFKYKKSLNAELILYLMWEQASFAELEPFMGIYDKVVVANSWLKNNLRKVYPNTPIEQVEHYANYYTKTAEGSPEQFVFGFSGGLWERKKVDLLMEAFYQSKTKDDILKIHSRRQANTAEMLQKFYAIYNQFKSQIEFQNKTLNDNDFAQWWNSLNCYVFISAGEAYSITPRQALMQGTPVILSKNTSHLDLLDVPGILWVECTEKNTASYSGNADIGSNTGIQYEPQLDSVIECMKEVKKNYSHWKAEAKKGGAIVQERTSVNNIKAQWRKIVND
jgi:glycosyltransferase involved in cell wall biosynthesis